MEDNAPELREPRKLTDLAEFAPEYIRFMRAVPENAVCETLVDYAHDYFRDVSPPERALRSLAIMVVDRMYLHATTLVTLGGEDRLYYARVFRYLLDVLACRGVRTFFILDNEMRLDRFHLMMTLFMSAGISVVTPYTVSEGPLSLDVVRRQIDIELLAGRHIAYIEMDATVNYLSSIMDKARATDSLAFLRNRAPDDRYVEHIPSRRVPSDGV